VCRLMTDNGISCYRMRDCHVMITKLNNKHFEPLKVKFLDVSFVEQFYVDISQHRTNFTV
jgi:hypothetical protein